MNYKRQIQFGIMLWVVLFVIYSIIIFIPFLQGLELLQSIIFWVINIPILVFLSKWYFKGVKPTWKRGLQLGIIAVVVGTVLDLIITQLFIAGNYQDFLKEFYGNWMLYIGFLEVILITTLAGAEFDGTFSKNK